MKCFYCGSEVPDDAKFCPECGRRIHQNDNSCRNDGCGKVYGGYRVTPRMGLGESLSSAMRKYVTFSGRARRSEYWWFNLFCGGICLIFTFAFLLCVVALDEVADMEIDDFPQSASAVALCVFYVISSLIIAIALFLPSLSLTVRRLHDTNRSGWWVLIALLPYIGGIIMLVFELLDSDKDENGYGPSPKYEKV